MRRFITVLSFQLSISCFLFAAEEPLVWQISKDRLNALPTIDITTENPPIATGDAARISIEHFKTKHPHITDFTPLFIKLTSMELKGKSIWYYEVACSYYNPNTKDTDAISANILLDGKPLVAITGSQVDS